MSGLGAVFILRAAVGIRGGALGWEYRELQCVSGVCFLLGEKDCGNWQGAFGLGRWLRALAWESN